MPEERQGGKPASAWRQPSGRKQAAEQRPQPAAAGRPRRRSSSLVVAGVAIAVIASATRPKVVDHGRGAGRCHRDLRLPDRHGHQARVDLYEDFQCPSASSTRPTSEPTSRPSRPRARRASSYHPLNFLDRVRRLEPGRRQAELDASRERRRLRAGPGQVPGVPRHRLPEPAGERGHRVHRHPADRVREGRPGCRT